jgi:FMN phosphatase YigB (HAD superfamily)
MNLTLVVGNAIQFPLSSKTLMVPTLLLDLDDTLLSNPIQTFQPAYLEALCSHLNQHFKQDQIVVDLMSATQKMIDNHHPDRTLENVFDHNFYPALGVTKFELQNDINNFYTNEFPKLRKITAVRPIAKKLVETAKNKGWQLAIATNPLFPLTAIIQRLEWAGFPKPDRYFDIIPSYESFHFAKPNPAFYGEILGQLGSQSGPFMMVGNDLDLDIFPAAKFGISTFWLDDTKQKPGKLSPQPTFHGSLEDLVQWLEVGDPGSLTNEFTSPDSLVATLRSTPAALSTLLKKIQNRDIPLLSNNHEWGYTEIICHLRDVDREVYLPRIKSVLTEDNPFLPGIDSDRWAEERNYRSQDIYCALDEYSATRIEIISLLENLTPNEWERHSRHAIFGPTKLIELVGFSTSHDRNHLSQWQKVGQK